jgi:hypothetical protein
MKLSELINKLQNVTHSDVDVVTRGSAPSTFVDVENVRVIKTKSGRTVLFIGKPKAPVTA